MPGSATDYLRQRVLSHTLSYGAYVMPAGTYIALVTTLPSATTPGIEVSTAGTGYARQRGTFALVAGRTDLAATTVTIEYPPATIAWGAIGYFELWDAPTAGNRLYWGPLVDPTDGVTPITKNVTTGDIVRLPATNVTVQAI